MQNRSIYKTIYAPLFNMGDIQVRQSLPSSAIEYLDPFVLLHHGHLVLDPSIDLKHAGVGPHPHRGFSPVTYVFKGGTRHRDSRGNDHKVYAGGTQWMNSGMGIMHSERPLEHEMEIIQMWINSPGKNKMDVPFYFPLEKENTPQYLTDDKLVEVNIVTGSMFGIQGPIPTITAIQSATLHIQPNGKLLLPIPQGHNAFLYLLDGTLKLNETSIVEGLHMVVLNNDGDGIQMEGIENTSALFMSGEPIGEEIATHGPFVMNTQTEIMEAYRDLRIGKMGILIEE